MKYPLLIGAAVLAAAPLTLLTTDAEACSPASESITWTLPAEGEIITPDDRILLFTAGMPSGDREVSLKSIDGSTDFDHTVEYRTMAGLFAAYIEVIPDDPLVGGTYSLSITYPDTDWSNDFDLTFSVASSLAVPSAPEAVSFQWYRETHAQPTGNSCIWGDEYHSVLLEPLNEDPAYYQVTFEGDDFDIIQIFRPQELNGQLRSYAISGVDCVTVAAYLQDGTSGDIITECTPHKCNHIDDPDSFGLGVTNWEEIAGCGDNGDNGDNGDDGDDGDDGDNGDNGDEGDDGDDGDDGDNNGDDGDDDNNGDDGDDGDTDTDEDTFEDELQSEGCACAASNGGLPSSGFLAVVLLGLFFLRRR